MNTLVLPILIPSVTGALCLLGWRHRNFQRWVGVLGTVLHLGSACFVLARVLSGGIQVTRMGDWPAPFGIILVADLLGAIMVVVTGVIGSLVAVFSLSSVDKNEEAFGYYPLFNFLLMGVSGAFLTGDLFNLYVWFEVLLMSSFVLLSLGGRPAQVEGSIKYVSLNLLSSALFLAAVGILYGIAGTLNMADLSVVIRSHDQPHLITAVAMLFLVAFGIKAAVFPLYFWLPASYHTPAFPVSALFAGLLTKVGVYALIRVFTLLFVHDPKWTHSIILTVSVMTMIAGVLGAVSQNEMRRVLSFHIISQIGYMTMGLGLFTPLAISGSIFYIVHHILVKTNLFLVSGLVHRSRGTCELKDLGGLYRSSPGLAILFLVPALSLAGMPPLSGFFAKFALTRAGLESGEYLVVLTSLVVGLLTLFSMTKIWNEAFWKPDPRSGGGHPPRLPSSMILPSVALAALTVCIGLAGSVFWDISYRAGKELMDPAVYIQAVLGRTP